MKIVFGSIAYGKLVGSFTDCTNLSPLNNAFSSFNFKNTDMEGPKSDINTRAQPKLNLNFAPFHTS